MLLLSVNSLFPPVLYVLLVYFILTKPPLHVTTICVHPGLFMCRLFMCAPYAFTKVRGGERSPVETEPPLILAVDLEGVQWAAELSTFESFERPVCLHRHSPSVSSSLSALGASPQTLSQVGPATKGPHIGPISDTGRFTVQAFDPHNTRWFSDVG